MRYHNVNVQINDHRNGGPSNRIGGVSISGVIELEPCIIPPPRYSMSEKWISIHRKKFRYVAHQTWVGNWCWDSLSMSESTVCQMIAHLLSQRCGNERLWTVQSASGEAMIALSDRVDETFRRAIEWGQSPLIHTEDVAIAMNAAALESEAANGMA